MRALDDERATQAQLQTELGLARQQVEAKTKECATVQQEALQREGDYKARIAVADALLKEKQAKEEQVSRFVALMCVYVSSTFFCHVQTMKRISEQDALAETLRAQVQSGFEKLSM